MKTSKGEVILVVLVIAVLLYIGTTVPGSDRKNITARMTEHGEKIVDISRCWVQHGPYWLAKDYRIYQVTTDKGEYWIRFGGFSGPDIEKKVGSGYAEETW